MSYFGLLPLKTTLIRTCLGPGFGIGTSFIVTLGPFPAILMISSSLIPPLHRNPPTYDSFLHICCACKLCLSMFDCFAVEENGNREEKYL